MLSCSSILITCSNLYSQTTTEPGTTIPNSKLRAAAQLIEIGKINAEKLSYYKQLTDTLNRRIAKLQQQINVQTAADTATQHIIETYKQDVANLQQQRDLAAATVKKQNKLYRRQKRKTVFVAIAGPAVTTALFLYLKK